MKNILVLFICFLIQNSFSQTSSAGIIEGKVVDQTSGEPLVGVKVSIDNTEYKTRTDVDGHFVLKGFKFGIYSITFSFHGHDSNTISDVKIDNEEVYLLNASLQVASKEIGPVHVVHKVTKSSDEDVLKLRTKTVNMIDVISEESIKKLPASNVAQVLARGTGLSIQDNKFVVIRGLNDRYNAAYLNDGPLPSSESDRKAFSFDVFPSNLLDNILIIKTATPDLPAEFAGGIIQINTKGIPSKNFQSVILGGGYNTITTFKDKLSYKGGKTDWLGMDDGTRALPGVIPEHKDYPITISGQADLAKQFNSDWNIESKKFMPNVNLQYALGINDTIFGKEFGVITSLTYNQTKNYNQTIRRGYSGNGSEGKGVSQIEFDYLDKVYSTQTLAGLMANFTLKLNDRNKFGLKNLYSINSDDRVISRSGERDPLELNPTLIKSNVLWFTSNKIYSGQINGEHHLTENLKFNWIGSYSNINRTIPNLRRSIYTRYKFINNPDDPNPLDTVYRANISNSNVGPDYGGGMFFSTNHENIASIKGDLKYDLHKFLGIKSEIKIGGLYQIRDRSFEARQLGYTKYNVVGGGNVKFNNDLSYLDQNTIYSSANMGLIEPGVGGFKLTDGTKYSDAYTANSSTSAGYLMIDNKIHKKVRLIWGARAEYFVQNLSADKSKKIHLDLATEKLDILPSLNAIYSIHKKQNFKFAFSETLNRPEFRELAPFAFYDFNTQFVVSGNDSLKRAKITNLDLRYEYLPGKAQLLSATMFYKKFIDPIEQISRADVAGETSFKNVPTAINYGIELEVRSVIGSLIKSDSTSIMNNFTFYSNLAIIRSIVDVSDIIGTSYSSRPLQGQSPYVFNSGLTYLDEKINMSITANINKVGDRIAILGNINQPDIWEKGRTFLDLQVSKLLLNKKMEIKLNFQNVLAQRQIFYQNKTSLTSYNTKGQEFLNSILIGDKKNENAYFDNRDDLIWSTIFGRTISVSISMKF